MYKDEIEEIIKDAEKSLNPKPSENRQGLYIAIFIMGMLVGVLLAGYAINESKNSTYREDLLY